MYIYISRKTIPGMACNVRRTAMCRFKDGHPLVSIER